MEEDDEQHQTLDALLAVMFTERSRASSAQSRQGSACGDVICDLDSEQEAVADGGGTLRKNLLFRQADARSKAPVPAIKRLSLSDHQIVTFDVGGQVFRCRAELVLRFPTKRLAQLITCGCARVQDNSEASFFIDRNPTHFQRILDWYRSPADTASAVSLACKDPSFQEDARYFDLFDELFPPVAKPNALPVPPRPRRQQIEAALARASPEASKHSLQRPKSLQLLSTKPIYPVSKPVQERLRPNKGPVCQEGEDANKMLQFVKREYRALASESTPFIYAVRKGEELHVARVKGSGRLLLRVCDATGMKQLHVAQAVLFDSQACFYNQDEWIALGRQGQLPGDHTYTFWVESFASEPSKSKSDSNTMQVEFKLISSFHWNQRADNDMQSRGSFSDAPASDPLAVLLPSLMLPPQQQQHPAMSPKTRKDLPENQSQTNQHEAAALGNCMSASRDAIAGRIFRVDNRSPEKQQSIVRKNAQKPKISFPMAAASPSSSAIKRSGAAIALGSPHQHKQDAPGKMTIYHPEKLVIHERERISSSLLAPSYHDLQPRSFY